MEPAISVILPILTKSNYTYKTLKCLCSQLFKDFEVIVINDSDCDYSETINIFSKKLNINYIMNNSKLELARSFNKGIMASRGKYICYLEEKFYYYENYLLNLANKILKSDDDVIYSNGINIEQLFENGNLVNITREIYHSNNFCSSRICHIDYIPIA